MTRNTRTSRPFSDGTEECRNGRLDVEQAVRERYSAAALAPQAELCCPVEYDPRYLAVVPEEIRRRDYGCGDPSRYVREGEVVLDLGCGGGKICYVAAQIVGPQGRVVGVDSNREMLALARKYQREVGDRLGYHNVEFRRGRIQDLQLDLDRLDPVLGEDPVRSSDDWLRLADRVRALRRDAPLIADESIDVIVSNCVLNLVPPEDRRGLFAEMHRILQPGGRAVISDIVSDRDVPERLRNDPRLWSGCIGGAYREDRLPAAFEEAGFHSIEVVTRQSDPWSVVEGIEFRSVTVRAYREVAVAREEREEPAVQVESIPPVVDCGGGRCC